MVRAVLDTNVIVSGTISSSGAPFGVLEAWRDRRFGLVISLEILKEAARVFSYPKIKDAYGLDDATIEQVLIRLAKYSAVTPGDLTVTEIEDDPADDMFLACAAEGEADYIVSGYRHMLDLGTYRGVRIVTAAGFLAVLEDRV